MKDAGVAAVDRALSILGAFQESDASLSLAELAGRTGLYKSTLLRLAASLEKAGYLRRLHDGRFQLGPALLRLGELYQASFRLEDHVLPTLNALAAETGESTSFYIRDGDTRVCLFRTNSLAHRVLHYVTPGTRLPLHTGAAGRVLMAFSEPGSAEQYLKERREGLAVSDQDRKSDTTAIACPVFRPGGLAGALSLAGPRNRFTEEAVTSMSALLLQRARELTESLGGAWLDPKSL